jgi:hypothetical protein
LGGVIFQQVEGMPDRVAAIAEAVRGALEANDQFAARAWRQ